MHVCSLYSSSQHGVVLQRNTGLCSTTKNGTINRLTTVAAAGKPPRRIAFPQRQKQRFVQPGRLSTPTPIHRGKPRGPPPPPGSETGVDAVNVRKLLEEKQQQEGSDEARRQRHATLETSTSGRSGGVRSKRVAIQQQQRGNGVASNGAGGTKGFGGDGLPLPTNAKGWQARRDWLVMSMEESLLDDATFHSLQTKLGLDDQSRPQISLLYALGMGERELARLLDSRRYVLELGVPTLQNKLRFLRQEVGLTDADIVKLLNKFPRILEYRSEKTILRHIEFFLRAGVEKSDISKVVMRAPMVLEFSIPNTLQPRLDFLTQHAHVPEASLGKLIGRHPLVLTCTEEGMRARVDFLTNELGMEPEDVGKAVLAHPQILQYAVSAMRRRVAYMRSVGMSQEQAAAAFARLPQLFSLDVNNNLMPKVRYLVQELGGDVATLSNYPAYLSLSLTNRIIPRHRFLEAHHKCVPRPFPMSYLKCSDKKFAHDVAGSSLQRFEHFRDVLATSTHTQAAVRR